MSIWTTPVTVATGTNLTASLWNDQLGESGSLSWLYERVRVTTAVTKSTNTVITSGTYVFVWDQLAGAYANIQQNINVALPANNVVLPYEGLYTCTMFFRYSVAASAFFSFNVLNTTNSTTESFFVDTTLRANIITSVSTLIYAPVGGSSQLSVSVTPSVGGTSVAITGTLAQALYIAKAGW